MRQKICKYNIMFLSLVMSSLLLAMPARAYAACSSDSPEGAFCEKYYNSLNPGSTDPAFSQDVANIDYEWGNGSRDPSVNVNKFSAVYKGMFTFEDGTYQFTTTTDDGVRLYVDGELVIDKWINQSTRSYVYQKSLSAGSHEIEMKYFENEGLATAKLNWFKVDATLNCTSETPDNVFCAKYFNNEKLEGGFKYSQTVPEVNYDWVFGSPNANIPNNYFSAVYSGKFNFANAGVYKFTTTTDDGVRLYVDGELVIDKWIAQPFTTYTASKYLNEGVHTVKMEYFEANGVAKAMLSWNLETDGCNLDEFGNNEFCARFYKPKAAVNTVSVDSSAHIPVINFNYGNGSPSPLVPTDNFAATFKGNFDIVEAGTYQFTTTSDDGVRLKVDGNTILDKWVNQPSSVHSALLSIDVTGPHAIELWYFDSGGQANVKLTWSKLILSLNCSSDNPVNKFCAKYYNGINFDVGPLKSEDLVNINKNYGGNSPGVQINNDFFSANYKGTFNFASSGVYRFTTSTDDGTRLRVDNNLLINKWIAQSYTSYFVDVPLEAGTHPIDMDYFERTGAAIVKLTWVKIGELPTPSPTPTPTPTVTPTPGTTEPIIISFTAPGSDAFTAFTAPEGYKSMDVHVTGTDSILDWAMAVSFNSGVSYAEQHRFACGSTDCGVKTLPVLSNFLRYQSGGDSGIVSVTVTFNAEPSSQVLTLSPAMNYTFTSGTFNTTGFTNSIISVGGGDNPQHLTGVMLEKFNGSGFDLKQSESCDGGAICPLTTYALENGYYRVIVSGTGINGVLGMLMRP